MTNEIKKITNRLGDLNLLASADNPKGIVVSSDNAYTVHLADDATDGWYRVDRLTAALASVEALKSDQDPAEWYASFWSAIEQCRITEAASHAAAIARDEVTAPDEWRRINAAHCDYNARGSKRAHWYRMIWTGAAWEYFGDGRLATVGQSAATRHQTITGEVQIGTLVVQHDWGGLIDTAYVVQDGEKPLKCCEVKRRAGELHITLPDGSKVKRPDPRKK